MILVDTSVWILTFRRRAPLDLEAHVSLGETVAFLPIVQDVLQGFRDDRAHRIAREAMLAFPRIEDPLGEGLFLEASSLYRAARRRGLTVRSSTDCLIAAAALRHGVEVLHHDQDFTCLASVSALRQRRV